MSSPAAPIVSVSVPTAAERRPAVASEAAQAAVAAIRRVPPPVNDPNRAYLPGSPERAELKARLKAMASEKIEIPIIIGGREITRLCRSFSEGGSEGGSEGKPQETFAILGSSGFVEIGINRGSAAEVLDVGRGTPVAVALDVRTAKDE